MISLKKILVFCGLIFATFAMAAEPATESMAKPNPADVAFSHAFIGIEGGEIYPFGDLVDAVHSSKYGGFGFRYTYWEDFDGFIHFNYTYFDVRANGIPFPGVHQFIGRLGLDWKWKSISPLALGAGFTCNWTRADTDDESISGRGGMLTDNETEFGYFFRGNLPFIRTENYQAGLNILWENLWTLPERSNMLSIGIYVERRLW